MCHVPVGYQGAFDARPTALLSTRIVGSYIMKKDLTGLAFGAVMMLCVFSGFVHAANSPLELITPQSGTLYRVGDKVNISFTSKGLRNRLVNLDVSHDNGVTFVPIGILDGTVRPAPKFYSFLWTVTGPPTATAIVRATIAGQPRYAPKLPESSPLPPRPLRAVKWSSPPI